MSLPKILEVENNKVVINEVILSIPEFRELYGSLDVDTALMCFQYIHSMYDPESPYMNLDESTKEEEILKDFPVHKYLNDLEMIAAIEKAEKLYDSPARRILRGTKIAVDKLMVYFSEMSILDGRDGNITAIKSSIIDMPKIIKSYYEAENTYKQQVQRNRSLQKNAADDGVIDDYND